MKTIKTQYKKGVAILLTFIMLAGVMLPVGATLETEDIIPFSGSLAGRSVNFGFNTEPVWTGARLTVNDVSVGTFRYSAWLDGAEYEAYCINPDRPGPEDAGVPPYVISRARPELLHILRFGHPNNYRMTQAGTGYYYPSDYAAYMTRTASVLAAAGSGAVLGGDTTSFMWQVVHGLAHGTSSWQIEDGMFSPARWVRVNGVENAVQIGTNNGDGMIVSDVFNITNSHNNNPVMFRWLPGTPTGTQLLDTYHNHLSTYPNLPYNNAFHSMGFRLAVPDGATVENAGVEIVGIHDAYAGQAWSARTTLQEDTWQEMLFYIPAMRATATMTPPEAGEPGQFRILKTDMQGVPLSGAVFELTGNDSQLPLTVTVPVNGWTSSEFPIGTVITVRETIPPANHLLGANPVQTITIGQTEIVTLTFQNPEVPPDCPPCPDRPPSIVRIQKINALSRENIPGALIRLRGISSHSIVTGDGQILSLNTTGIDVSQVLTAGATIAPGEITSVVTDGVWTIYNLPYGAFFVEELRAPEHFSLLPANTGQAFWHLPPDIGIEADGTPILCPETGAILDINIEYRIIEHPQHGLTNMILKTFENFPFGIIELDKICEKTRMPIPGVVFQIEGYFPESNQQGIPTQRMATTDSRGRIRWEDLPAGLFAITELSSAPGWINSGETITVPLTWGQTTTVVVTNTPKSSLEVLKICGDTSAPLAGAIFELRDPTTGERWQATSGANGIAVFGRGSNGNYLLPNHAYQLTELVAPDGFVPLARLHEIVLSPGNDNRITVRNWRNPSLTIVKRDRDTHERLPGAVFEVQFENGQTVSGSPFTTDSNGGIVLPWTLLEGDEERTLLISEISAPFGFHLDDPNWRLVTMRQGENNVVTFENTRKPTITIIKRDSRTNAPIPNTEFTVEKLDNPGRGMLTGNPFRTDENGKIVIPYQHEGIFRIIEKRAGRHYWLDSNEANRTWTIELRGNEDYVLNVENTLLPSLIITKMNALNNRPVPFTHFRVEFEVPNSPNVELIGNFVTDARGQIILPFVRPGWYRLTETRAGVGMSLPSNPVTRVYLSPGQNTYSLLDLIPNLMERDAGRQVSVSTSSTNSSNPIDGNDDNNADNADNDLPPSDDDNNGGNGNLEDSETPSNPSNPSSNGITVTDGDDWLTGENIWNFPLNSIVVKKSCANTGTMLSGATFELRRVTGGLSGTSGTLVGTYTTGASGIIVITGLEPGGWIIEETIPPNSFTLAENNIQQAWLAPDQTSIVELNFRNVPYGSLLIVKTNSTNGRGLANARFRVTYADGTLVGNANGIFTTSSNGEILIPNIAPGSSLVVTEIASPPGFKLDSTPQTIQIGSTGRTYRLEFQNTPIPRMPSLTILKICSESRRPLQNVHFEISTIDGTRLRNPRTGMFEFITDRNGLIYLPEIEDGRTYFLRETRSLPGFMIDQELIPFSVDARVRRQENILVVENTPIASLRLLKRCSVTQRPIFNTEFMIFDSNNRVIGVFTTDNRGMIEADFAPQRVTIRETRAAEGFSLDNMPRTVDLIAGRTVDVVWDNAPVQGQIIITKRSSQYNPMTNLPAGSLLEGAAFEVLDRAGNIVDRMVSDSRGIAASRPLPPSLYRIREVSAPRFYQLSDRIIYAEIRRDGDIVRFEVLNDNVRLGTTIQKKGHRQAFAGQQIRYDLYDIRNISTAPLQNFYVYDRIPTDAVRIDRLFTGTWNQRVIYTVSFRTNHRYYRVLRDNLHNNINYEICLNPQTLGLAYGEYVTDIRFEFGTVQPGFANVENIIILCTVLPNLPAGYNFTNRAMVGGQYGGEWILERSSWVTIIQPPFIPNRPLPQTGF
ncbi:MAG: SpaA isopeptide-forming pilin-related protein [Oscillospiraceae bacterium]|nr:SpaA isopeptide-forming pilin-related protein [Oscillospiraceae bacterium]